MRLIWLCTWLALSGCVATDVGNPETNPPTEAEVRVEAYEEELPNALMLDDGVELTHIWLATDLIGLKRCESESETEGETEAEPEDEDELGLERPTVTDLLTGVSFPDVPVLRVQGVGFCGFDLRARPLTVAELPAGAPPDLVGAAFVVRGVRKDGNPFVLRSAAEESFELEGEIRLDPEVRRRLAVGFAVNGWVTQRELGPLAGNPILIDADNNSALLETFTERVAESARLFDGAIGGPLLAE